MSRRMVIVVIVALIAAAPQAAVFTKGASTEGGQKVVAQPKKNGRRGLVGAIAGALLGAAIEHATKPREEKPKDPQLPKDPLPPEKKPFPPEADPLEDAKWQSAWEEREAQFEKIDQDQPTDEQKLWAMDTLRQEAAFIQRHFVRSGEGLGEDYGGYYMDLAIFVTGLKDPRSIGALSVATDVAPSVATTLAELGEPAVDPVIDMLGNQFLRESAAFTLGKFLQGRREGRSKISDASAAKIRAVLIGASVSGVPSLQRNAIRAFRYVDLDGKEREMLMRVGASNPQLAREVERILAAH